MKPDRVVIGAEDPRGAELMVALYQPFTRTGAPVMVMDCASAELCEVRGERPARHAHLVHERSRQRLRALRRRRRSRAAGGRLGSADRHRRSCFPGVGYGGSCFPEGREGADALLGRSQKYDFKVLKAVEAVNESQKRLLVRKMEKHFGVVEGPHDRDLGPGVQAQDRRHARGAGDSDRQDAAREGREGAGLRSGGDGGGARDLRHRRSPTRRRATTRFAAPMRWRSSPSGRSSASPTSPACAS